MLWMETDGKRKEEERREGDDGARGTEGTFRWGGMATVRGTGAYWLCWPLRDD